MIWQYGEVKLELFKTHMNIVSEHIKFTTESSKQKIAFLDTLVKLEGISIHTDLYSKPIESHNYLYYNSAYPQKCKDSIP